MTLSTNTFLVGVSDGKLFPVTADSVSAYTCGVAVEIPGIQNFQIDPNILSKVMSGDDADLETYMKIKGCKFSFECGYMDLNLLATLVGGEVVSAGSSPNGLNTYSLLQGDVPGYFQIAFQVTNLTPGIACQDFRLMKCKVNALPLDSKQDEFSTFKISGDAVFTAKQFTRGAKTAGLLMEVVNKETLAALTATIV